MARVCTYSRRGFMSGTKIVWPSIWHHSTSSTKLCRILILFMRKPMLFLYHTQKLTFYRKEGMWTQRNWESNTNQKKNLKRVLGRFTITNKVISETIKFLQEYSQITISRARWMSLNSGVSTSDGRMLKKFMAKVQSLFKLNSNLCV